MLRLYLPLLAGFIIVQIYVWIVLVEGQVHQCVIVCPWAEWNAAILLIKRKPLQINVTCATKYRPRYPGDVTIRVDDKQRLPLVFEAFVGIIQQLYVMLEREWAWQSDGGQIVVVWWIPCQIRIVPILIQYSNKINNFARQSFFNCLNIYKVVPYVCDQSLTVWILDEKGFLVKVFALIWITSLTY